MVWLWHPSQPEAWHLNVPLISGVSVFAGMGGAAIAPPTSLVEKDKECTYPLPLPAALLLPFNPVLGPQAPRPLALTLGPGAGSSRPRPLPGGFVQGSEAWTFIR